MTQGQLVTRVRNVHLAPHTLPTVSWHFTTWSPNTKRDTADLFRGSPASKLPLEIHFEAAACILYGPFTSWFRWLPVGVASMVLMRQEESCGADPASVPEARGRMRPSPLPSLPPTPGRNVRGAGASWSWNLRVLPQSEPKDRSHRVRASRVPGGH